MVVNLIAIRVILKTLGVIDYGIYSAIGGVVLSFSFLSQTIVSASQRFFAIEIGVSSLKKLRDTFLAVFVSYLIIAVISFFILETIGLWVVSEKMVIPEERMFVTHYLYQFTIITFIIGLFTNPFIAIIIAEENMRFFAYISLLEGFLKLLTAFTLSFFAFDHLILYGLLLLLVSIINFLCYFIYCRIHYDYIRFSKVVNYPLLKEVLTFSSWTLFGTIAGTAKNQGVNVLLNVFGGPILNTAFSVSHQVTGLLSQVSNSFFSAVRPPLIKSVALNDNERTMDLYYFSSKILFILLGFIVIPIGILIKEFLSLWLGEVECHMITFTRLLLLEAMISILSNPITSIIHAAGYVKEYHGIVDSFLLLVLPIVYVLFSLGNAAESAFVVLIIMVSAAHIIRLLILRRRLNISLKGYMLNFAVPAAFVFSVTLLISIIVYKFVENYSSIIVICLVSFVSILGVLLFSYLILLTKSERNTLSNLGHNVLNHVR